MDFDTFKIEITYFFDYYQRPLSDYILNIWYEFLSKYLTSEEIKTVLAKAITEEKELPTPEHLVKSIKGSGYFLLLALEKQQEQESQSL